MSAARGERIPPDGVPELATCAATADGTLDCRALRGAGAVPVGAPIYHLRATADWQPRPATSADPSLDSGTGSQTEDVVREIFGRPLSQDELALFLLIVSPAKAEPAEVTTMTAAPRGSAGSAQQAR